MLLNLLSSKFMGQHRDANRESGRRKRMPKLNRKGGGGRRCDKVIGIANNTRASSHLRMGASGTAIMQFGTRMICRMQVGYEQLAGSLIGEEWEKNHCARQQ